MKVLFLSAWYPTPENPNLGIFIREHAKSIHTVGNEIVVLAVVSMQSKSLIKIKHREFMDDAGIRTIEVIIYSRFRDLVYHLIPLQNRIAFHYYKKIISQNFTPDVIHSNVIFPAGIAGDFISRKLRKPHIITEHWSKIDGLLRKPYLSGRAKKTYCNADYIMPVSVFLKNNILRLMPELPSCKFQVVPNVISSEIFGYKQKEKHENEIRFCAVATWATKKVPDKKPELFIEALNEVQQKTDKSIHLTMIGGGDRVEELKQLCARQSFKTEFVGYQSKNKIAEFIQASDFFLHASTVETFGVVIVEALMTGTPVICSNVGALPELINETNGVLCENTVDEWVKGIEKALYADFERLEFAEKVKNDYTYEIVGKKVHEIYNLLLIE